MGNILQGVRYGEPKSRRSQEVLFLRCFLSGRDDHHEAILLDATRRVQSVPRSGCGPLYTIQKALEG